MRRLLVLLPLVVAGIFFTAGPAGADCVGPTITYSVGQVSIGDVVQVDGMGWGDNCYDTGPPPEGEGSLGNPRTDITIVLVQDGQEIVVAEGNADDRYEFFVEVVIPSALTPGVFTIETRPESWVDVAGKLELLESDQVVEVVVEDFGPDEPVAARPIPGAGVEEPASDGPPYFLLALAAIVLASVAVAIRFRPSN